MERFSKFFKVFRPESEPEVVVGDMGEKGMNATTTKYDLPPSDVLHLTDKLQAFRFLVGIHTSRSLQANLRDRPAGNMGLYRRVVLYERRAGHAFNGYQILINSCLLLQIIIAAALTALGAANSSGKQSAAKSSTSAKAVTVFGAINTILAGILTFLKGSGVPNRYKFYRAEWRKVREYIEQRERDFGREGCPLDVWSEVAVIEKMYNMVKEDIEVNTPDAYVSVSSARKRGGLDIPIPEHTLPTAALSGPFVPPTPPALSNNTQYGFPGKVASKVQEAETAVQQFENSKVSQKVAEAESAVQQFSQHGVGQRVNEAEQAVGSFQRSTTNTVTTVENSTSSSSGAL